MHNKSAPRAQSSTFTSAQASSAGRLNRRSALGMVSAAALAVAVLLAGCSPKQGDSPNNSAPAPQPPAPQLMVHDEQRPVAPVGGSAHRLHIMSEKAVAAAAPAPASVTDASANVISEHDSAAPQRFLAVRHHLQIESPAADLAGLWTAVKERCEQLDCQVEASALQRETSHSAGAAYLTMRVNPRDFAMLTAALGGSAKVLNHQTSSEDKTGEVIDVEAQIKNRTEYRDSLRELLREKDVKRKLTDLMEIRDTLSQVQAEIDAANSQRKLLEKETAKQFVQMQFQPQQVIISGEYSPWRQTWERSWGALTDSAQTMVLATAALLPWLIVLGLVALIVAVVVRRKIRATRNATVVVAAPEPEIQKS